MPASNPPGSPADHLAKIINPKDKREAIWLWLHLEEQAKFRHETCNGSTMVDVLDAYIDGRSDKHLKWLVGRKDRSLLPKDDLSWIEEDRRQIAYLERQIRPDVPLVRHPRLSGRTRLIASLDTWDERLDEKATFLARVKRNWNTQKNTYTKYCAWLKEKDQPKRVEHAFSWIEKNSRKLDLGFIPRDVNTFEDLLIYFDTQELRPLEVKEIINSTRVSWNREQHQKRNVDKKQMNVMLPNTAIKALDLLAKKTSLSRAEIIERLITRETKEEMYLD